MKSKRRRTTHTKAFDPDLLTSNGIAVLLRQIQMIFIMDINDTHTQLAKRKSYLHRTRIQRTMVHHHLRKKIQFKGSHGGKISLRFFSQSSKTIALICQWDQRPVVNSRFLHLLGRRCSERYMSQRCIKRQKEECAATSQSTRRSHPLKHKIKQTKCGWPSLFQRGERGTTDRHKVTGLQVGFPGARTETGTNHRTEIMGTEG